MMKPPPLLALLLLALTPPAVRAHEHFAAGIVDLNANGQPDAGEPLAFVGADGTDRTFHLLARPVGQRPTQRCGGYFMLDERPRTRFPADSFSLIALSDGQIELAAPGHAHTGAQIWVEILAVEGPSGARFGFWEENWSASHDAPSVSFAVNQPFAPYRFPLSEGAVDDAEDPQGHIHGRAWTADQPGDYALRFRLVDRSTTGPDGGPWHAPSGTYVYRFSAGPRFRLTPARNSAAGTLTLTWPSRMGTDDADPTQTGILFRVERATALTPANWQPLGTVTGTTADVATFTDPAPPAGGPAFYRLNFDWSTATSP